MRKERQALPARGPLSTRRSLPSAVIQTHAQLNSNNSFTLPTKGKDLWLKLDNPTYPSPSLIDQLDLYERGFPSNAMRIHVLGVGSIGSIIALHLRHSTRHPITLLVKRRSFAETFRKELQHTISVEHNGIITRADDFTIEFTDPAANRMLGLLQRPDGQLRSRFLLPASETSHSDPPSSALKNEPILSLIVTTKAPSTFRVLQVLAPRLSPSSTVTLLQNGMGVYEELCARLFPNPDKRPHFILASTTHGAWSKRSFHVVHAARGDLVFCVAPDKRVNLPTEIKPEISKNLEDTRDDPMTKYKNLFERLAPHDTLYETLQALLSLSGLAPQWLGAGALQERIQRKLVVNSVINPLTALINVRNGALATSGQARRISEFVCAEASNVFRAQAIEDGVDLSPGLTAESLQAEVTRVVAMTAANWSSMLQDVRSGHATEVDYMNGYIVRMGKTYGVATPCNEMLRALVEMKHQMPFGEAT